MADFNSKLDLISRRGTPVGAEELIERIEAQLAGDPLVVVTQRRMGALMTKTDQSVTTKSPGPGRGLVWALAAFVAVLAVAGIYLATSGGKDEVAETTPTTVAEPTPTSAAQVETSAELETIETAVAAFYSGDADGAADLFDLADRTEDQIRAESAYQAAIGGRLTLNCVEGTPGTFQCRVPYHNAMTDAIGFADHGDTNRIVVEDGVITEFGFPEHSWMLLDMAAFLASEGRFDGYEDCSFGPFSESCATIQMENLDAWAAWHETAEPADKVETVVKSWYGGECAAAIFLSWEGGDCSASSVPLEMIAYESTLGAQVSVENCETTSGGDHPNLSCEVHYSNAMNSAVGKPPSVTAREFVLMNGVFLAGPNEVPWYELDYPEDTELRESFQQFAEGGELAAAYADAGCASARSSECAELIVDNLDAWAAWHQENG